MSSVRLIEILEVFSTLKALSLALYTSGLLNVILVSPPKAVIETGVIIVLVPSSFFLTTLYLLKSVVGAVKLNVNELPL